MTDSEWSEKRKRANQIAEQIKDIQKRMACIKEAKKALPTGYEPEFAHINQDWGKPLGDEGRKHLDDARESLRLCLIAAEIHLFDLKIELTELELARLKYDREWVS